MSDKTVNFDNLMSIRQQQWRDFGRDDVYREIAALDPSIGVDDDTWSACYFCGVRAEINPANREYTYAHTHDCLWLRAQAVK